MGDFSKKEKRDDLLTRCYVRKAQNIYESLHIPDDILYIIYLYYHMKIIAIEWSDKFKTDNKLWVISDDNKQLINKGVRRAYILANTVPIVNGVYCFRLFTTCNTTLFVGFCEQRYYNDQQVIGKRYTCGDTVNFGLYSNEKKEKKKTKKKSNIQIDLMLNCNQNMIYIGIVQQQKVGSKIHEITQRVGENTWGLVPVIQINNIGYAATFKCTILQIDPTLYQHQINTKQI
eukprot:282134_1